MGGVLKGRWAAVGDGCVCVSASEASGRIAERKTLLKHQSMGGFGSLLFFAVACTAGGASPPVNQPAPEQRLEPGQSPDSYGWTPRLPPGGSLVLVDRKTQSTFSLSGEAIAGPLAEQRRLLRQVPGVNMFWFAWSVFYPGSELWGHSQGVRQATLPETKTGDLGCGGGRDCIPSLPNTGPPAGDLAWLRVDQAGYLDDDDLVLGVFYQGAARAYPHNLLWWHEIANDKIGDQSLSVTFCPLTGSGVVFAAGAEGRTFGVSGQLFNSNLVMYDHQSRALWPQLWMGAVSGAQTDGVWLAQFPQSEMTWRRWKTLHPETLVLSDQTGYSRSYRSYPYGDYRTDDSDTFRRTDPLPDPAYPNKAMTFGLVDRQRGTAKAFLHADLAVRGARVVLNEHFGDQPIVVVYDQEAELVVAFSAETPEGTLAFDAGSFTP